MNTNKVINLSNYIQRKTIEKENKLKQIDNFKRDNEDDRQRTLNLFMRVIETIRKESY